MKIIIHGLGRMGMQIARKLSEDHHTVIAHNRSQDKIDEAAGFGAVKATTKEAAVAASGEDTVLWIMLPADVVDDQVDQWIPLLPPKSLIIDGGNSDFRLTRKLSDRVKQHGFELIDIGVSGGVWGYTNGFSMMCGGNDRDSYTKITPLLDSLAKPEGAYDYFGASGSGHFVKMVHNAIEYGIMESLAEGYRVLKDGPYQGIDLAAAGNVWQHHSVITSWLNELCRDILKDNPALTGIDGYVAENGEARWTLEIAKAANIPLPAIQAAMGVRIASQQGQVNFATQLLAAMRNRFGGHQLNHTDE